MSAFLLRIDFRIFDGPRGGLAFDFIPSKHVLTDQLGYDRHGPDVFSVREEVFLFIEGIVADVVPDWRNFRHWGITCLSAATWLEILSRFSSIRRDVRGNVRVEVIVGRYVLAPAILPRRGKFHRKALPTFLDLFETRVLQALRDHPYLVICGV